MNNNLILLSIIIPVYNVENYLAQCIDSIGPSNKGSFEIILIDDGSTDSSSIICDKYAKKYNKVRVFHKENGGLSSARNYGISMSKGKWITFIDSDDLVSKNYLDFIFKSIFFKKNADLILFNFNTFSQKKNVHKVLQNSFNIKKISKDSAMTQLTLPSCGNYAWNKVYRKDLWNTITFPDGKNFEDIATTYKIVEKANQIYYLTDTLYLYRQRANSITSNLKKEKQVESFRQMLEFRIEQLNFFKAKGFINAYKNAMHYLVSASIGFANISSIVNICDLTTDIKAKEIIKKYKVSLKKDGFKLYLQVKLFKFSPELYKFLFYLLYRIMQVFHVNII